MEAGSSDVGRILTQTPPANLEVSPSQTVDVVVGESSASDDTDFDPRPIDDTTGEDDGISQTGADADPDPDGPSVEAPTGS